MMSRIATSLPKPDAERIIAGLRNVGATDWNIIKPLLAPELLTSATDIKMDLKIIAGIVIVMINVMFVRPAAVTELPK